MFAFKVEAEDPRTLIDNNYYLCVQKSTTGGDIKNPVQWLSSKLRGKTVNVSWEASYSIFFSTTQIQAGAVIDQSSIQGISGLGTCWDFKSGVFDATRVTVPTSTVRIRNLDALPGNFGISQAARVDSQSSTISPLAINAILPNGYGDYTPLETVTVYFSNKNTSPGCITTAQSSTAVVTLKAGQKPTLLYSKDGIWTTEWPPLADERAALRSPFPQLAVSSLYLVQADVLVENHTELWRSSVLRAVHAHAQENHIMIFREPNRHSSEGGRRYKFVFAGKTLHETEQAVRELVGKAVEQVYRIHTPSGGDRIQGVSTTISRVDIEEGKPAIVAWNNSIKKLDA